MNATLLVVLASLCFRFILAGGSGLGIDESYMVAASSHFAASYFDHPLASWWLELGARHVFGSAAPLVVRLPFVLLSGVSSWLLYLVTRRLFGAKAGFWAVVAFSIAPVFSLAFGSWVLPDGPLNAALLAFLYALIRALGLPERKPAPYWWLAAGLFAGVAMLSKYNAALVLMGAALSVVLDPAGRRELGRPWPWLGVLLALLLFSPVVIWNAQHHWASFDYQGGRATGLRLRPLMPLSIWGGEALYVLPWLWAPMIWLLIRAFIAGAAQRASWLLGWASVIPVLLFAVVGLWSHTHILFHWAAPGYLMLFPLLGDWAVRRSPRLMGTVAAISGGLLACAALLIVGLVQFGLPPVLANSFKPGKSPMLQAVDWVSIGRAMPPGIDAVAAQRWFDAGKIGYALRRDGIDIPVTVFGRAPHQFVFTTPPQSLLGKTVLLIAMPGSSTATWNRFAPDFVSLKPGPVLPVLDHGRILLLIPTFIGTDLKHIPG
ncbi:glycosyltransferase family 39 protein [Acidocella sp.]|uniref:glycosyltransferase family 39 protein n=1 Tax=Acidocella sp. TaxID=50710 RepID=UPI003D07C184